MTHLVSTTEDSLDEDQLVTFVYLFGTSHLAQELKNLLANAGDAGSIPGHRRSPGGGNGSLLQYSYLGNPVDRGAWQGYSPWGHKELDTTEHACIQALVLYRRILIYAGCAKLLKSSAYFECT